jgi:hypothetical protein
LKTTNTEVPGSIPGHYLGFFWGSWVWNGVHSASWSDKLSIYLNKEVTVRFGKLKMQLWDSMCWPHVNPVPSGAVGKDCQRRLLSRPKVRHSCSASDYISLCMLVIISLVALFPTNLDLFSGPVVFPSWLYLVVYLIVVCITCNCCCCVLKVRCVFQDVCSATHISHKIRTDDVMNNQTVEVFKNM